MLPNELRVVASQTSFGREFHSPGSIFRKTMLEIKLGSVNTQLKKELQVISWKQIDEYLQKIGRV